MTTTYLLKLKCDNEKPNFKRDTKVADYMIFEDSEPSTSFESFSKNFWGVIWSLITGPENEFQYVTTVLKKMKQSVSTYLTKHKSKKVTILN